MKAIKLASVFAVSAVAAAVSTSTFAAEPVFSGEAGIEYVSYYGESKDIGDLADGTDLGEVELSIDTGVVYAEIEVKTTGDDEGTDINFEKLYVKQGAVSFGRFDGSVSTGAFMGMDELQSGVDLRTDQGDTDNTGLRYAVAPGLTVALEATTNSNDDSDIGAAISYVVDLDAVKLGISGGAIGDANSVNVGAQFNAGPATLSANYGVGETGTDNTTDVQQAGFGVELAATDALTLILQYSKDLEGEKEDGTYFVAEYAAGDLTYYYKNYNGDLAADSSYEGSEHHTVGVKAFF